MVCPRLAGSCNLGRAAACASVLAFCKLPVMLLCSTFAWANHTLLQQLLTAVPSNVLFLEWMRVQTSQQLLPLSNTQLMS